MRYFVACGGELEVWLEGGSIFVKPMENLSYFVLAQQVFIAVLEKFAPRTAAAEKITDYR